MGITITIFTNAPVHSDIAVPKQHSKERKPVEACVPGYLSFIYMSLCLYSVCIRMA